MQRETRNKNALRRHQNSIERSLADVSSGKNVNHLPPEAVAELMTDLQKRLATLNERLALVGDH